MDRYFCDTECSGKWVRYRHMIGVADVIKMDKETRENFLKGSSIDEFISNGMVVCGPKD